MIPFGIPDPSSESKIADWVEFYVTFPEEPISKSELRSHIEASKGSEIEEDFLDSVWMEMKRREQLYGTNPPFETQDEIIESKIRWEDKPEYMTCLILSIFGNNYKPTYTGKLFERITNEAIRNFVKGESLIYGYPGTPCLEDVAILLCERFISNPPYNVKDRGLDIISWKPFGDKRSNQIVILIQCAAGNNWRSKTGKLPIEAWRQYIHWACNPITGFSMPRIISKEDFHEISLDCHCGLLLDRARIYRNTASFTFHADLRDELEAWCKDMLGTISS